jgi:hypothetical protein
MKRAAMPLFLVPALPLLAILLAAPSSGSTDPLLTKIGTAGCADAVLLQRPGWTTSGTWTPDGNTLILADALNHTLTKYSSTGRSLGPLTGSIGTALRHLQPSVLRSNDSTQEVLIEVQDGATSRLLAMDKNLVPNRAIDVESTAWLQGSQRASGLFQWQPVGNDLVTFSDIQGPRENDWASGIVRFAGKVQAPPLGAPEQVEVLRPIGLNDTERTFYRLGFPYITAVGNTAYVLTMGTTPGISKDTAPDGSKASSLLPVANTLSTGPSAELNPDLPTLQTPQDFVAVMSVVERSAMPVGLFGWNKNLYVLSRFPQGDATGWLLRKFSLSGELRSAMRIPSSAAHLTVVPGPITWAFVEKGPVLAYGAQDIKTILFVPSALIQTMPPVQQSASLINAPSLCREDR